MKTLRLILGDQLNIKHSWFKNQDDLVVYCLFEMRQETDYVVHHIQKVIGFFAAMRDFAETLKKAGHQVEYFKLDSEENTQNLKQNIELLISKYSIKNFEYQHPDEYRLDEQLKNICKELSIPSQVYSTQHFYTERDELKAFFEGKKDYVMEYFYRDMRKRHNILMDGNKPVGGKWNYDKSNRKSWSGQPKIPSYKLFKNNVDGIIEMLENSDVKTIGQFNTKTFNYPINREQALSQLKYFCEHLLLHFGDYQDAMHTDEAYLFHSRLSFVLNLKLISPKNVVDTVINYWNKTNNSIHISQVEGFIRQIVGWREYMRGIYWMLMPEFSTENKLNNQKALPDFYWTGNTKMNCLKHAINNSLGNAYAHHIQRLMITGNFALLIGVNPDEVDAWYLGIYIDAIEWAQITNTRGMSQFADGGKIATKPYVSSGSYINKMSNYCSRCHYKHTKKTETDACPFNSLYWSFLYEKKQYLKDNPRMGMMYNVLEKMKDEDIKSIRKKAQHILNNLNSY